MIVIERHIEHSSRRDIYKVIVMSCLHVGNAHCREDAIRKLVKQIAAEENTYFISLGDMADYIALADVKRREFTDMAEWLFDNHGEGLADIGRAENIVLKNYFQGLGPKCLALCEGNHESAIRKHCECDAYAAQVEMLADGNNAHRLDHRGVLRLKFTRLGGSTWYYTIMASHGSGAGVCEGSVNNRLKTIVNEFDGIDLHLIGHWHKPAQIWPQKFRPGLQFTDKHVINAIAVPSLCADLRYAEDRDKEPLVMGYWELNINPDKEKVDLQFREVT
jgi:hypothetical protein